MGRLQLWARGGLHGAVLGTGAGDGRGTPARGTWHGCPNICVQVNPPLLPLTPVTPQGHLPKSCLGTPQPAAGGVPCDPKTGAGLGGGHPNAGSGGPGRSPLLCLPGAEPPAGTTRGSPGLSIVRAAARGRILLWAPPCQLRGGSKGGLGCSPARHSLVLHACSISAFPCIRDCGMNI